MSLSCLRLVLMSPNHQEIRNYLSIYLCVCHNIKNIKWWWIICSILNLKCLKKPIVLAFSLRSVDRASPPLLHAEPRRTVADVPSPRTDSQPGVPAPLPLWFKLLRTFLQQVLQGPRWLLRSLQLWPQRLQGLHGGLDGTRVQRRWERKLK